jgi:UDP-N-acetylmuramate dehydrogenase
LDYAEQLTSLCEEHDIEYSRGVSLAGKCTFKTGGDCAWFLEPASEDGIAALAAFLNGNGIPWIVLGRGSNVLFPDGGYDGVAVHLGERFSAIEQTGDAAITCQSGASLTALCRFALELGLSGLEFAYGIPGSVGGAVAMNAGAYGGEMKDVLLAARHIGPDGELGTFSAEELKLSYRHSAYTDSGNIITGAEFGLRRGDRDEIRARMEDFMERRRSKQPLDFPSAGSTFKRPEGAYAAALIDQCGLKGFSVGGATVSGKHAGFVINSGGATSADILALIAEVRRIVREKTGYELEPEVRIY